MHSFGDCPTGQILLDKQTLQIITIKNNRITCKTIQILITKKCAGVRHGKVKVFALLCSSALSLLLILRHS